MYYWTGMVKLNTFSREWKAPRSKLPRQASMSSITLLVDIISKLLLYDMYLKCCSSQHISEMFSWQVSVLKILYIHEFKHFNWTPVHVCSEVTLRIWRVRMWSWCLVWRRDRSRWSTSRGRQSNMAECTIGWRHSWTKWPQRLLTHRTRYVVDDNLRLLCFSVMLLKFSCIAWHSMIYLGAKIRKFRRPKNVDSIR